MIEFAKAVYEIVVWFFLLYSLAILGIYAWIAFYAYGALNKYRRKNLFTDYNLIVTNPNAPSFSLVAPAYNEGLTIVENVRSLLSLYYQNLEIIIVNDGSKDDSIQRLIDAYQLEATTFYVQGKIPTKAIKAVYRSKNPAFKKLLVVDKENGGKADALNVGINVSTGDYLVCIDVDCILEQDAILKLAKPFLEETDKRIIACGGVIRLANNCEITDGKITEVRLPESWLGRCQALEYIRAFVLGRMAWSRASGLILISGAFGAFDKEIVLACGGYDSKTVGEDMELVVRMRRYMEEQKLPYDVVNIPDPLCWTEVPESKEILRKQRNRWMRGTIETLWKHRKMMFNPAYGKLGMVSLPYWFFFEFLGPIIEYVGYLVFTLFFILGIINWQFFFTLFALVVASGILYSVFAVLVDLMSHQVYTKKVDLSKLLTAAVIEPFYFHPFIVKSSVNGVRDYFRNQHGWGEMTRQGFAKRDKEHSPWKHLYTRVIGALQLYSWPAASFILLTLFTTLAENKWYNYRLNDLAEQSMILPHLISNNLDFALQAIVIVFIGFLVVYLINPIRARRLLVVTFSLLIVLHFLLFLYFAESRNLLGSDAFIYGYDELVHILKTSGMLNSTNIAFCILLLSLTITLFSLLNRFVVTLTWPIVTLLGLSGLAFIIQPDKWFTTKTEAVKNTVTPKSSYFLASNFDHWLEGQEHYLAHFTEKTGQTHLDNAYPFMFEESTPDFLGSYFEKSATPPHLVVLVVEGLGHAYSSPNGYIGNFTPFLDSLTSKSLYWENTLSTSGRTFAALPSILGSLPFGESGFLSIQPVPNHFNLLNVLQKNGFKAHFYYGGHANFDNMLPFIAYNQGVSITEYQDYDDTFRKLPANSGSESWGYEDQALFKKMLSDYSDTPVIKVGLTLSTHNPFLINHQAYYERLFTQHVARLGLKGEQKKWALDNQKALTAVINFDESLRLFMDEYAQRNDYQNTIFVITGDHAMPEIAFQNKIDRYHVPLIIYSPLLKKSKAFKHVVSHFDITPSLLAFYRENYQIKTPTHVTWLGQGLAQTTTSGYPLMQSKNQLHDYVYRTYHLAEGNLYELSPKLGEELIENDGIKNRVNQQFTRFKEMNKSFISTQKLLPDSVYNTFMR